MTSATPTTHMHDSHPIDGRVTCQNCDHDYVGQYCSQCSQRADTHAINWHYIWHEIPHSLWHLDRGMAFTIKELLTRPGHTIREFLEGRRVNHYRPLAMLLFLGAILVFASHSLDINLAKIGADVGQKMGKNVFGQNTPAHVQADVTHMQGSIINYLEDKPAYTVILLIPFFALGYWLLFRRRGYNYPEFLVAQTFIANVYLLNSILILGLFWLLGASAETFKTVMGFSFVIMIAYNTITYYQFFKQQISLLGVFIRSTVAFVVGYVSFGIIMGLIGLVIGIGMGIKEDRSTPEPKTNVRAPQSHK